MSLFSDAIAQGLATVSDVAGELVSYQRGDVALPNLIAVPGSTRFGTEDVEDFGVASTSSDWTFAVADLSIGGTPFTPKRGDRVVHQGRTYEVGFDGEQVWRYSDRGRTRIRVHTKQLGG